MTSFITVPLEGADVWQGAPEFSLFSHTSHGYRSVKSCNKLDFASTFDMELTIWRKYYKNVTLLDI